MVLSLLFAWLPMASAVAAESDTQQQETITGTVLDDTGEPIIGASVIVDGTGTGTITDLDGNFTLKVAPGTKLKISFIGFTEQIVSAKNNMTVILKEDSMTMQEVEVIAYGVQKKVTVTGAISSVKSEDLTRTPMGSVSNVLGGQLTGLTTVQYSGEPGADAADIFIRGQATWSDSSPLVQIDGVVRDYSDMAALDPNEIESITVLKDASATAVFGVRGANGVILVTTKRGKAGKATVSFSTSASIVSPTKLIETANSYEYATFHNAMRANDGLEPMFSQEVLDMFKNHTDPIRFPDVNWTDYIMRNVTIQSQHNMTISGGTDRVRYFISAAAYTQGGMFKEYDVPYNLSFQYRRFNYRANLDMDVTKTTLVSLDISGNVDNNDRPNNSQGTAGIVKNIYYATPFFSPGIVNGKMVYSTNEAYSDGLSLPFVGDVDPMTYRNGNSAHNSNNRLSINATIEQKLDFVTKGLSFRLKGAYNSSFTVSKIGSAAIATYQPKLLEDGSIGYQKSGEDGGVSWSYSTGKARDWYMEAGFNYARTFGDHSVTALLLYNQSKEYYYGSNYSDVPRGYVGLVGRITYDYKNKYMADINIGYNGSENFSPEHRFGTFPAGSIGWVMSEEKFFKPLKPWVSFLKLRVSLGLVGNDKTSDADLRFLYLSDPYITNSSDLQNRSQTTDDHYGYSYGINNSSTSLGTYEASKNNPEVSWEKALKQNYGIDINFFDDRLAAAFDYYYERRWNILLQDGTAPAIIGFNVPYSNQGEVHSWGWELSLKWNDRVGKDFRYWATFNLSYNQNKIIERKEAPQEYDYQYQKGHRIGARKQYLFYRYYDEGTEARYEAEFNRPYPTQISHLQYGDCVYVDLNGDRIIDNNDMSYDYGFTNDPEYMAGLTLGFSYKGWELNMQWTGAWNVSRVISDVYQRPFLSSAGNQYGGLVKYHLDNTWTAENPSQDAKYPRATWENADNNYATSTLYEQDSKYLRLKTLQLAYNFDLPFMKKIGMHQFQLALSGYNLFTFTPYLWGDPESVASSAPTYPLTRSYSLSLKLGF